MKPYVLLSLIWNPYSLQRSFTVYKSTISSLTHCLLGYKWHPWKSHLHHFEEYQVLAVCIAGPWSVFICTNVLLHWYPPWNTLLYWNIFGEARMHFAKRSAVLKWTNLLIQCLTFKLHVFISYPSINLKMPKYKSLGTLHKPQSVFL